MNRRGLMGAAVLQFVLVIVALAVAEVALRVIDPLFLQPVSIDVQLLYDHDSELGWFPIPNSVQTFTGGRAVHVRNNSLGFRDVELDDTSKRTIAFVGDSFVWGYDVEEDERFTNILRGTIPDYRIVNLGITAYGTDQEYLVLKRVWNRIRPDIVVLMICVDNDRIENSTNVRFDGPYKPYFDLSRNEFRGQPVPWSRHLNFRHYWLARNSWLVRLVISAYVYVKHPPLTQPDPTDHLIEMMRDFAQTNGARFFVGLQRHDERYESLLHAKNIPFVSFDDAEVYPSHGNHWTSKGNVFVADRLRTWLTNGGNDLGPPVQLRR